MVSVQVRGGHQDRSQRPLQLRSGKKYKKCAAANKLFGLFEQKGGQALCFSLSPLLFDPVAMRRSIGS
ncbi:MAG: hypothetical protein R2864_08000 [Syntrophotaleaceae bacterium]